MHRIFALRVPFFLNHLAKANKNFSLVKHENFPRKELFELSKKTLSIQLNRYKSQSSNAILNDKGSDSIFKRFKDAYKQHGKILVTCHFISSWGWIISFFFLAKAGLDIISVLQGLENLKIISRDTVDSIQKKIDTFNLEKYLKESFFSHILSENLIKSIGELFTGKTLKLMITAIMLYKLITPIRYIFTVALTNFLIKLFKRHGRIPLQPPPGSSIKELYTEQKQVIRRRLKMHKNSKKNSFKNNIIKASQSIFNKANRRKTF